MIKIAIITYSDSITCARLAGLKGLTANTFPSVSDVDNIREIVYSAIGQIIGYATPDINGVAKMIETNKVKNAIISIAKNAVDSSQGVNYTLELTKSEIETLKKNFTKNVSGYFGISSK